MGIRSDQDEDEANNITLDSELSATALYNSADTSKNDPVVDRGDKFDAAAKRLK